MLEVMSYEGGVREFSRLTSVSRQTFLKALMCFFDCLSEIVWNLRGVALEPVSLYCMSENDRSRRRNSCEDSHVCWISLNHSDFLQLKNDLETS